MGEGPRKATVSSEGLRLDQALAECFKDLGRRAARAALSEGRVFVDGKRCKIAGRTLAAGSMLTLYRDPAVSARSDSAPVPILYEDEAWLVVDKPAHLVVNETETTAEETLVERFSDRDARVVHRLDRGTTGVMVLAKGQKAAAELSRAFAERAVFKVYWAAVEGAPMDTVVDVPIGRDRRRPRARAVGFEGQSAQTKVEVLARTEDLALLIARPITGRTHQIRVHLAHIGSPIVGDALYGGPTAIRLGEDVFRPERPLLHAETLVLPHPSGLKTFRSPIPEDLARVVSALGFRA